MRHCEWCRGDLVPTARADSKTCSQRCRQARHRFQRGLVARARASRPLRLAYADPPYPSTARRYYGAEPDYAGEVDHGELLSRLDRYDGWALSTSAAALPQVLALAVAQGLGVRVAAWAKGSRNQRALVPRSSWEPVVFAGGRRLLDGAVALRGRATSRGDRGDVSRATSIDDSLICRSRPRATEGRRVIGMKPAAFVWWVFDLLGALPGDELDDLYPGSGGVGRAWDFYCRAGLAA